MNDTLKMAREALALALNEFAGLPHSLGYEFTHAPKIAAAIAAIDAQAPQAAPLDVDHLPGTSGDSLNDAMAWVAQAAPVGAPSDGPDFTRIAFEAWWKRHGEFIRAGGGDYEKCFAWGAWQAAAAIPCECEFNRQHNITPEQAAPVALTDAKNAQRYLWLRSGNTIPLDMCGCCQLQGDELDADIDAQMAAGAAAQGGEQRGGLTQCDMHEDESY